MKKAFALIACGVIGVSLLSGCGDNGLADNSNPPDIVNVGNDDTARIVEIEGVRCVVVNGYRSTAVSCDWGND